MKKINLFEPYSNKEEITAITKVIKSGWWKEGAVCEELEEEFCKYTNAHHAISVNSATAGLDLIFKTYGIKDCEVIMPSLTFISTGLAALYNNCKVVFADIDPITLTLDPQDVEKKVTKQTKAIVLQHQSGNPCDLDAFEQFKAKNILIIEDAAHGAGSFYKNEHVGVRNPSAFSFNVIKNIAAGEGGIVTVPDRDKAEKMKSLRWYGIDMKQWHEEGKKYKWDYAISETGYKYHFNDILASIALVQLKRLREMNCIRSVLAETYTENLRNLPMQLPHIREQCISSWHQYIIRVDKDDRNMLIDYLAKHNIGSGVHFKPINLYPMFDRGNTPITDNEWQRMITLPLHPNLKASQVKSICKVLTMYYE